MQKEPITMEGILSLTRASRSGTKPTVLDLRGYQNSEGCVTEHMAIVPWQGENTLYRTLLEHSIEWMERAVKPVDFLEKDWNVAMEQSIASWEKSVDKIKSAVSGEAGAFSKKPTFLVEAEYPDILIERDAEKNIIGVAVDRALRTFTSESDGAAQKSIAHRDAITAAKAYIRASSPMKYYVGRVIFRAGKVQDIVATVVTDDYAQIVDQVVSGVSTRG